MKSKFYIIIFSVIFGIMALALIVKMFDLGNQNDRPRPSDDYKVYTLALDSGYVGSFDNWKSALALESDHNVYLNVIENKLCWRYEDSNEWIIIYDFLDSLLEDDVNSYEISKVSFSENSETYVIKYSTGNTENFTINYGEQGITSITNLNGTIITIGENGNFYINGNDSKNPSNISCATNYGISCIEMVGGSSSYLDYNVVYANGYQSSFRIMYEGHNMTGVISSNNQNLGIVTISENQEFIIDGVNSKVLADLKLSLGDSISGINKEPNSNNYMISYTDGRTKDFIINQNSDGTGGIISEDLITIGPDNNYYINGINSLQQYKENIEPSKLISKITKGDFDGIYDQYEITYGDTSKISFGVATNEKIVESINTESDNIITIGKNGNFFINGVDTYQASNISLDISKGISNLKKIDTINHEYLIHYTNGETATFSLTTKAGELDISTNPDIDIRIGDNGNLFFNGIDSNMKADIHEVVINNISCFKITVKKDCYEILFSDNTVIQFEINYNEVNWILSITNISSLEKITVGVDNTVYINNYDTGFTIETRKFIGDINDPYNIGDIIHRRGNE